MDTRTRSQRRVKRMSHDYSPHTPPEPYLILRGAQHPSPTLALSVYIRSRTSLTCGQPLCLSLSRRRSETQSAQTAGHREAYSADRRSLKFERLPSHHPTQPQNFSSQLCTHFESNRAWVHGIANRHSQHLPKPYHHPAAAAPRKRARLPTPAAAPPCSPRAPHVVPAMSITWNEGFCRRRIHEGTLHVTT